MPEDNPVKTTARIRSQLSAGEFDFSRHAFQRVEV